MSNIPYLVNSSCSIGLVEINRRLNRGVIMETMTKKENRVNELEKHYKNLEDVCNYYGLKVDGKKLSSKLRKLEKEIHQQTTNSCNGVGIVGGYTYYTGQIDVYAKREYGVYVKSAYATAAALETGETIFDIEIEKLSEQVKKMIPGVPFFVNGDARGYALKIKDAEMDKLFKAGIRLHQDWGGYGILSPEIE